MLGFLRPLFTLHLVVSSTINWTCSRSIASHLVLSKLPPPHCAPSNTICQVPSGLGQTPLIFTRTRRFSSHINLASCLHMTFMNFWSGPVMSMPKPLVTANYFFYGVDPFPSISRYTPSIVLIKLQAFSAHNFKGFWQKSFAQFCLPSHHHFQNCWNVPLSEINHSHFCYRDQTARKNLLCNW